MFIEFLFVATLDMSLPEFQPQEDLSGNYIVMEYDSTNDEIVVDEIPVEDIDGLSVEPQTEEVPLLRSSGDGYLTLTKQRNCAIKNENGQYYIRSRSSYNYYIDYVLLSSGVTYDLDYNGDIYIGSSYAIDSQVFLYTSNTITPSSDIYIIQYHQTDYYLNVSISSSGGDVSGDDVSGGESGGDVSGDDVSGGNSGGNVIADLTNVESKLDRVIDLLRSILLVLIISFLYPLIMSCLKLMKGGRYV